MSAAARIAEESEQRPRASPYRGRERLALTRIEKGNYLIEVSRADATDKTPVVGQVQLRMLGVKQRIDVRLDPI